MTAADTIEKRKDQRIPLSKKDAMYCVVIRSKSTGNTTIAISTADFSESGFQFAVIPAMKEDFFVGEGLCLKAIIGTRNLTFKEPISLSVAWQKYDAEADVIRVGCEVCAIGNDAEKQLTTFVEGEIKFSGIRISDGFRSKNADPEEKVVFFQPVTPSAHIVSVSAEPSVPSVSPEPSPLPVPKNNAGLTALSIFGGHSDTGNTAVLLSRVENELKAVGYEIERVNLFEKKINGCDQCLKCQENAYKPGCVQKDGVAQILDAMINSNLILYASPVDYTGFSLPMKALMERCFSLSRGAIGTPSHHSFVEGRYQALVATTTGSMMVDGTPALTMFHDLGRRQKTRLAGTFFVCHCQDTQPLETDMDEQAKQFAHQLLDRSRWPYALLMPDEVSP
ncbi:flavodoxin family protein [Desulfosarcina sp. OttesenSCG-928-B08]|nr:flavodoxin family protein [Desulfosarcina sp. OttesenSCG-928-B08]